MGEGTDYHTFHQQKSGAMILVTGATGLVGSHLLVELTSQGKRVRALKRTSSSTDAVKMLFCHYQIPENSFNQIEWIEGDVTDYNSIILALTGVAEVYHCAGLVSFKKSDLYKLLEVNVQGTANMVDASLQCGVKKFCHVCSIATLGSPKDSSVDESCAWEKTKGKSGYAVSKFRAEMEVWRGIEQGLNATIVNPSVILGPSSWTSGSGLLFKAVEKGLPFYTLGMTGYVDVRDVVKGMISAMEKEQWGKRFVHNGQNLTHKELFTTIALAMGKKPPFIEIKPWMVMVIKPFVWLASLLSSKLETSVSGFYSKTQYSSDRAEKVLEMKFHPISEAVANTVKAGRI